MLNQYKDSKAFKTLLRRQGQVVTRLNRIRENFSKKRQQISMLSVKPQEKPENRESIVNELRMAHTNQHRTANPNASSMDTTQNYQSSRPKISINALLGGQDSANLKPYLQQQGKPSTSHLPGVRSTRHMNMHATNFSESKNQRPRTQNRQFKRESIEPSLVISND